MIKKVIKLGATFLLSLTFLAPLNVRANEVVVNTSQEECPTGMSCKYQWDNKLGVYMLANVEEMVDNISLLEDSATNTSVSSIEVELYQDTYDIYKIFTYPNTSTFAASNINKINFYWSTSYSTKQYINVKFKFSLNHTTQALYDINYISVSGQHIDSYVIQNGQLIIDHTVNPNYSTGTMYVAINFNQPYNFNDTISLNVSVDEDPNGALNANMQAMNSAISTLVSKINELIPLVTNIDSHVSSIDNLLATTISPKLEQIRSILANDISIKLTNVNAHLSNIDTHIKALTTTVETKFNDLTTNLTTHFTNLGNWIQNQTTSINSKLDEVINAINGNGENTDRYEETVNLYSDNLSNLNGEIQDIEINLINNNVNSVGSINLDNSLLNVNDYKLTGQFVSNQMTRLYESNNVVKMMITYGLVIGIAFTVIGISLKR